MVFTAEQLAIAIAPSVENLSKLPDASLVRSLIRPYVYSGQVVSTAMVKRIRKL